MNHRPSVTIVAPVPPPYAGPEICTELLLSSPVADAFRLHHVRANVRTQNAAKGSFSWLAVLRQIAIYARVVVTRLRGSRVLYCLIAANTLGFIKDAGTIWLGRLLGMRVAGHLQGASLPTFHESSHPLLQRLIRATVTALDVLIVQAESIAEETQRRFGLRSDQISIIPNMVAEPAPCTNEREAGSLLFVGHLSQGKGFCDLIAAVSDILTEFPDAKLRCAGEPKRREQDYIAQLHGLVPGCAEGSIHSVLRGENPQIEYQGVVSGFAKHELFCRSAIVVLPSYSESFPMVILEAMSYSCAIVCTPVGAIPEFIQSGKNGRLVRPGDIDELRQAIRSLLKEPGLARRLGEAARESVRDRFSVEHVAIEYVRLLSSLAT